MRLILLYALLGAAVFCGAMYWPSDERIALVIPANDPARKR